MAKAYSYPCPYCGAEDYIKSVDEITETDIENATPCSDCERSAGE